MQENTQRRECVLPLQPHSGLNRSFSFRHFLVGRGGGGGCKLYADCNLNCDFFFFDFFDLVNHVGKYFSRSIKGTKSGVK